MEQGNKILLGKILGEIYRIEKRTNDMACPATEAQIYGLLNGFEHCIDEELEMTGAVTYEQYVTVLNVLDEIDMDPAKFEAFNGFYSIEDKLNSLGINRGKAIKIISYIYADRRFTTLIDKMDSAGSPMECRTFELSDFDR